MNPFLLAELEKIFGQENVSTGESAVKDKSLDLWPRNLFIKSNPPFSTAIAVVKTGTDYIRQIQALVLLVKQYGKKIVVRGGGSGVCGAANAENGEVVLETTNLNKIELVFYSRLCQKTGLVMAEAGVFGYQLDNFLKNQNITCGHYPASLNISTVGGWISTGANGQYSLYFGNIENIVEAVEGINGRAEIVRLEGDDLKKVLRLEGTTLIITKVWLKTVKVPARRLFQSFKFKETEEAINFLMDLPHLRSRLDENKVRFWAVRAYDYLDFHFISKPDRADSVKPAWLEKLEFSAERQLSHFGPRLEKIVQTLEKNKMASWICVICLASDHHEALLQGAKLVKETAAVWNGQTLDSNIARAWHENRFKLNYEKVQKRFRFGLTVDTFDCRPYWHKMAESYRLIRHKLFEYGLVGAHFGIDLNQPYIYFTFALPEKNKEKYAKVCREVLELCAANGIRTTHHHGVGQAKRGSDNRFLSYAYGRQWLENTARPAKKELDPENTFNPSNAF